MNCPHCKQEHPENFQFCPETGLEISSDSITNQTPDQNKIYDQNSEGNPSPSSLQTDHFFDAKEKKSIIIPILIFTAFIGIVLATIGIFFLLDIFPVSSVSLINKTQPSENVQNTIDISKLLQTNTPETSSNTFTTQSALLNPSILTDIPSGESQEFVEETISPDPNQANQQSPLEKDQKEISQTPTLKPIHTLTPTDDEYWTACPGYYLSRLHVGDKAKVSEDPPLSNRVRSKPDSTATILGYIEPGEKISILEGPSCKNGWIWWKMTSEKTGLTGWTVEGDNDGYWLVPIN